MKIVMLVAMISGCFVAGVGAQTNRTARAPTPSPAPSTAPADTQSVALSRVEFIGPPAPTKTQVDGALVRLRRRTAQAEPAIPSGGVKTRQDTDRLTTDSVTGQYTGYNLLVIKF